ncbi:hypothetical protein AXG93_2402s1150 [Marchantia polymorpha subsp. ruderalis]|uniref:Integrase catalytic domain-containing protein n=1 Tax=Marchantia polymorpha subsp. ruderalis TaxID=1480154 RepID=A0A176VW05_MARPO|nr:hypothetical protein AXG93_2402s1150 [Marchantia polymorpha subsp. ruderalis]
MTSKQLGGTGYNVLPLDGRGDYLLWEKQVKGKLRSMGLANVLRDKPMHIIDIDWRDTVYIVMGYLDPSVMKQVEEYPETLSKILLHRENKAITYNEVVSALLADEVEQEMSFTRPLSSSSDCDPSIFTPKRKTCLPTVYDVREEGITRHFTTVYTPQQNAVSERHNRTVLEKMRSMLSESGLPGEFWTEAVNTVVYLVNFSPSSAINFSTPFELRHKRMADYSVLKVFGCTAYPLTPKEHRTKLDPTSKNCRFLGYASGVKGYRLWDPLAVR